MANERKTKWSRLGFTKVHLRKGREGECVCVGGGGGEGGVGGRAGRGWLRGGGLEERGRVEESGVICQSLNKSPPPPHPPQEKRFQYNTILHAIRYNIDHNHYSIQYNFINREFVWHPFKRQTLNIT